MTNKVAIFDLDGTIIDTFLLVVKTVYKTFEEKLPEYKLTEEEANSFFGPTLAESFSKYVKTKEEVDELIKVYRRINFELMESYSKLFDGIDDVIITLKQRGYKVVILSNKITDSVIRGLEICKIEHLFDLVIGADKMSSPKPDPNGIYKIKDIYNTTDLVMIGDTIIDILTGQNAGIKTIGVTWCVTSLEEFKKHNATYIVEKPIELLEVLGG